ncbi:SAWADEE domain-containing protein [Heracleum sosnowskyi]|uniref:SAWADEE domain-containing protein n=1 Tax=Heracleum sosnowskyi TaxID=360622 RepID=A0AAD8M5K0_9APIA|nr:SAWADEE domain-containing protein [Heracleum sosnowskyi]
METEAPEFTLAEVLEMESLYKEKGEESLSEKCCQEVATKFSSSAHRIGKASIQCKQVESWFHEKHNRMAAKDTEHTSFKAFVSSLRNKASGSSSPATSGQVVPLTDTIRTPYKSKAERVAELSDLRYEALSAKDGAWFDVASFLNYRVLYSGEIEVRVRFSGFNHDEDEWVNMRRAVRERSIPLEPSECDKIKVGDPVLCYRANADHALYSDAHILEIERNIHDAEACSCMFLVRFDYDNTEAKVDLTQVCCRPT